MSKTYRLNRDFALVCDTDNYILKVIMIGVPFEPVIEEVRCGSSEEANDAFKALRLKYKEVV